MTQQEIADVARDLVVIPYYPRDEHDVILRQISKFADSEVRLRGTVDLAVTRMMTWGGIPALREIWEGLAPEFNPDPACVECGGIGWTIVFKGGAEGAKRCGCWAERKALEPAGEVLRLQGAGPYEVDIRQLTEGKAL